MLTLSLGAPFPTCRDGGVTFSEKSNYADVYVFDPEFPSLIYEMNLHVGPARLIVEFEIGPPVYTPGIVTIGGKR
jgi:hypothetical protein